MTIDPADPLATLPDDLLVTFRERAVRHDADNTFPDQDLADLRELGYLGLMVPVELGGAGATVSQAAALQRRLAQAAPATALSVNMHLIVTAAAMLAHRKGMAAAKQILTDAVAGELHAFGISEAGNDAMLFASRTSADLDGDGYRLTGTKIFTSAGPAWTRLVTHATIADQERLVFGVIERTEEVVTRNDWDTHGMRPTQSCTTVLTNAPMAPERVITTTEIGPSFDPFVFGIFGCFELLVTSVYVGIAERAVQLGVETARKRLNQLTGQPHSDDPDIRWRLADAAISVDGALLQLDKITADLDGWAEGTVDHGARWFLHFSGVKSRAGEAAMAAVDQVLRASGGSQYFRRSELERLSRDVRAVMYHPSDEESVHRSYAKALLGDIGS